MRSNQEVPMNRVDLVELRAALSDYITSQPLRLRRQGRPGRHGSIANADTKLVRDPTRCPTRGHDNDAPDSTGSSTSLAGRETEHGAQHEG